MFIGDDTDTVFELNLSTKKTDWPGTMTLIGSSGAKTRFLTDLMLRYLRGTPDHSKRQILWLSPELEIDKTIEPLKAHRWVMWFRGIDISAQAVKKSGLGAAAYYQQLRRGPDRDERRGRLDRPGRLPGRRAGPLPDAPGGLQQLDPCRAAPEPGHLQPAAHVRGRAQHEPEPAIEQVHRSQQNRCITFMRDHLMMQIGQARELVQRFAKLDRWMCIQMHSPVCIFCSSYLILV